MPYKNGTFFKNTSWKITRKLGSLMSDSDDINERNALATIAFKSRCTLWLR